MTTLFIEQKAGRLVRVPLGRDGILDGAYGIVLTAPGTRSASSDGDARRDRRSDARRLTHVRRRCSRRTATSETTSRDLRPLALNGPASVVLTSGAASARSGRSSRACARSRPGSTAIEWNGRFRRGVGEHEFRADLRGTSAVTTEQTVALRRGHQPGPCSDSSRGRTSVLHQRAGRHHGGVRRDRGRSRSAG